MEDYNYQKVDESCSKDAPDVIKMEEYLLIKLLMFDYVLFPYANIVPHRSGIEAKDRLYRFIFFIQL